MEKKKNTADANAPLFTQAEYIAIRNNLQEKSHRARLLDFLWQYGCVTNMQAYEVLDNTRVGSTVHDLRKMGVPIVTTMVRRKKREGYSSPYGVYSIRKEQRDV